jgi:catechol 2,3-dioxygenase-like lactoylglutathione lyase family enzyme
MKTNSIIPFIGSKDYKVSIAFYQSLGFREIEIDAKMSLFEIDGKRSFYLQDAYVKDWIDNTMLFWEVSDLLEIHKQIKSLNLAIKFPGVRVSEIRYDVWGDEFFVHDPAGILWHIGEFK